MHTPQIAVFLALSAFLAPLRTAFPQSRPHDSTKWFKRWLEEEVAYIITDPDYSKAGNRSESERILAIAPGKG
jgi:hypothetical protein